MGSASTIYRPRQALPSAAGGASSTSEFVFQDSSSNAIVLTVPNVGQLADASNSPTCVMKVYAAGRVTGGTTTNFTTQIQWGTSTTPASNTDLESSGADAVNSVSRSFYAELTLIYDVDSDRLCGIGTTLNAENLDAVAAINNTVTSVDLAAGTSEVGLVVTGTFSGSSASNAAYLDVFCLEVIG